MSFLYLTFWIAVVFLVNTGFYFTIRSEWNMRFKDKSLAVPQIIAATLITMVTIYFIDHARGAMLLLYIVSFTFGVFRLTVKQFFLLTLFALLSFGTVILLLVIFEPDRINIKIELIHLTVLAVVLPWFSLLGSYIHNLRKKVEKLAIYDELTDVFNRRQMTVILEREKSLADRGYPSFSLCLLDIDCFKLLNDTYGHHVGDIVLKELARLINDNLRDADMIARYGGEEFVIVLAYPDIKDARICAERIRDLAADQTYVVGSVEVKATVSIGVTRYDPVENVEKALSRADKALYVAKNNGRNRVECR